MIPRAVTNPLLLNLIFILSALVLLILTLFDRGFMKVCFVHLSYYLVWLLFLFWIQALVESAGLNKSKIKAFLRDHKTGLIFSVVLSAVVFLSITPELRFFSDETNLVSVSRSMAYDRTVSYVTQGISEEGKYLPLATAIPTRGLLSPFLTHIFHFVLGYRFQNAFIVNFLALFLILFVVYTLLRGRLGPVLTGAALVLITAHPVITLNATSAIAAIVETLFLVISFVFLAKFLASSSEVSFRALWTSVALLAFGRHESFVYFPVVFILLLALKYLKWEYFTKRHVYALTPWFFLPIVWQQIFSIPSLAVHPELRPHTLWFTAGNFMEHSALFIQALFNPLLRYPFAIPVTIVGVAGLVYYAYLYFFRKERLKERWMAHALVIAVLCLFVKWAITASSPVGDPVRFSTSRYYLVFGIVLTVLAVLFLAGFKSIKRRPYYCLCISLLVFVFYHPLSIENELSRKMYFNRDYYLVMDFLNKQRDKDFLLITHRPRQYVIHDFSVVSFRYANGNKDQLLVSFQKNDFSDIFVVQQIRDGSLTERDGTKLDRSFQLEALAEIRNRHNSFLRISRVVGTEAAARRISGVRTEKPEKGVTLKLVRTITHADINHPKSVGISADGRTVYVNNLHGHNTVVIDRKTSKVLKTIRYDGRACEMAIGRGDNLLWVSLAALEGDEYPPYIPEPAPGWENYDFPSVVLVVDPSRKSNEIVHRIPVEVKPKIVALSPDGKYAFVSNFISGTVSVIDARDYKVIRSVKVGKWPRGVCLTQNGRYAYVANMGSNDLSVISLETLDVAGRVEIPGVPRHLVASKDGAYIYISLSQREGAILKMKVSDNKIVGAARTGRTTRTIVLSPDERQIYAANYASHELSVVDTKAMREICRIETKRRPIGLDVTPDGKQLWVVSFRDSAVLVYDIINA